MGIKIYIIILYFVYELKIGESYSFLFIYFKKVPGLIEFGLCLTSPRVF